MDVEFKFDTKALDEALSKLPEKLQRIAARKAVKAGAQVIKDAMVTLAPERTDEPTPNSDSLPPGILKADIQVEIQSKPGYAPRAKIGAGELTAHQARWIENGWDLTTRGKGSHKGTKIRHIEGKHYMAQAFDESAQKATDVMIAVLNEEIKALGKSGQGE